MTRGEYRSIPADVYAARARAAKVRACCQAIIRNYPERTAAEVAQALRGATTLDWLQIAEVAGVAPLSETSRRQVIEAFEFSASLQPRRCARGHAACYSVACGGTE